MAWFVLTWNPDVWVKLTDADWNSYATGYEANALAVGPWSTGNRKSGIEGGDGLIFLRQGRERGVIAVGEAASRIYSGQHWQGRTRPGNYVDVLWTEVCRIDQRVPTGVLINHVPDVKWNSIRGSGVRIPDAAASRVRELWLEVRIKSPPAT